MPGLGKWPVHVERLRPGIRHVGCFARRKFDEAVKAGAKPGKAQMGLAFIGRRYAVERALKDADPETRERERHALTTTLLAELRAWLERSLPEVSPSSLIGKALTDLDRECGRGCSGDGGSG